MKGVGGREASSVGVLAALVLALAPAPLLAQTSDAQFDRLATALLGTTPLESDLHRSWLACPEIAARWDWVVAHSPRESRAEIDALMKNTDLADQMKSLGVWDGWANGTRGRQH